MSDSQQQLVTFSTDGAVGIVFINNPPVNALNAKVMVELNRVIDQLEKNNELRAVILAGAGNKAFVAGADIKEFPNLKEATGRELSLNGHAIFSRLENLKIPVICAIHGYALGAGLELALACDIRIADEQALLGMPEVTLGIIPGYGGTQRLPRLVGLGKAKELIFSGESINAEEAYRIGLIDKLVPLGKALNEAKLLADKIATRGPLAVSKAKSAVNLGFDTTLDEGIKIEAKYFGELCVTEDKIEGVRAFIEKRKALFNGR